MDLNPNINENKGFKLCQLVLCPYGIGRVVELYNTGVIIHIVGGEDVQNWGIIPYTLISTPSSLKVLYGE